MEQAKTAVFWDITSCDVPDDVDIGSITRSVRSALSNVNCFGPISFFAYGDTASMKKKIVDDISRTGFMLQQVQGEGDRFHAFGAITVAMFLWAKHNPGPANFLLISGNEDFSYALKQLRNSGYNVLLGHPHPHPMGEASGSLTRNANAVWYSEDLLAGGSPFPFFQFVNYETTTTAVEITFTDNEATASSSSSSSSSKDKTGSL